MTSQTYVVFLSSANGAFAQLRRYGTPRKHLDFSRLKHIGWTQTTGVKEGIALAYSDFNSHSRNDRSASGRNRNVGSFSFLLMRRFLLIGSVVLLWSASIAPVSDELCELIERQYPPTAAANATRADAILVLGGGVGTVLPPRVLPNLVTGASRSWYASRLFRAGKAPVVVAVAGRESAAMAEFLVDLGVARESILQESRSRTTVENALYVKPILEARGIRRSLLVTSALHMPRAVAIFRAVGIDVVPVSGDVEVVAVREYGWRDFLPSAEALLRTTRVVHEVLGLLGFRVQIWLAERA